MCRKYPIKNFTISFLICVPFMSLCADKTLRGADIEKQSSVLEILRRYQTKQEQITVSQPKERIVHFPEDRSIGRLYLVKKGPPEKRFWCYVLLDWEKINMGDARGDVKVPADRMLRLDVIGDVWRKTKAFTALEFDDVQILNLHRCDGVGDDLLSQIAHLTGLEALFINPSNLTPKGLIYIENFKNLKALGLPDNIQSKELALLQKLPLLEYLNFAGPMVNDTKLAQIGNLTWLTELYLGGSNVGAGLAYLKNLKSLRYLSLSANRVPDIDRHLAHISGLTELEELDLRDTLVGDAGLASLAGLTKLRKLSLFSNPGTQKITDAGMAHLKNLKSLEELYLPGGSLTDVGFTYLGQLNSLKKINAWGKGITDKSMATFAKMKSLEDLSIASSGVTDAGMPKISECTSLKALTLNRVSITDAGLAHLAKLKSLTSLIIFRTQIKGDGFAVLKELPLLTYLGLYFMNLDETGITQLSGMRSLDRLAIEYSTTNVGDRDLAHLAGLTSLKHLDITVSDASGSSITDEGLSYLSNLKGLESLSLNHCGNVTDAGLKHFEGLSMLKQLHLDESKVTMAGVARLKQKIPGVIVTVPCTMQAYQAQQKTTRQTPLRKGR